MTGTPVVETRYGRVRGLEDAGLRTFLSVPYGASPVGERRFQPPRPPEPWADVLDATGAPPICPQPAEALSGALGVRPELSPLMFGDSTRAFDHQSEDCLRVNVWAPANDAPVGGRAVMVWLHGGSWSIGSPVGARNDPTRTALDGDVVVVSVGHRLGLFGYLQLGALGGAEYASSANVGMLDVIAALEWVRDNIEAFGGDPGRVTVFGESGGGAKITNLLAMPAARGLFHRAILQSGVTGRGTDPEVAATCAEQILAELGLRPDQWRELLAMPAERLVAAHASFILAGGVARVRLVAPMVDGVHLPTDPLRAIAAGSSRGIPIVVGCTSREAALYLLADPGYGSDDEAVLTDRAGRLLGDRAPEVVDTYRAARPDAGPDDVLVAIATDQIQRMAAVRLAEAAIAGGTDQVFMYLFDWANPMLPEMGAHHGSDGPFIFNTTDVVPAAHADPHAPVLAARMNAAWTAFARHGAPPAEWPRYELDRRTTMVFGSETGPVDDPGAAERRCWLPTDRVGLG